MHTKRVSTLNLTVRDAILAVACASAFLSSAAVQAQNLVTNGDFSAGNTDFTSTYPFVPYSPNAYVYNGAYTVGPNVPASYFDWYPFYPVTPGGNLMTINGGTDATMAFWSQTVAVQANTNYTIGFYLAEISTPGDNADVAILSGSSSLGAFVAPLTQDVWQFNSVEWNSGSSTSLNLSLTDLNTDGFENDFAVDNIEVEAVPEPAPMLGLGVSLIGLIRVRKKRSR